MDIQYTLAYKWLEDMKKMKIEMLHLEGKT